MDLVDPIVNLQKRGRGANLFKRNYKRFLRYLQLNDNLTVLCIRVLQGVFVAYLASKSLPINQGNACRAFVGKIPMVGH